jgi:hypothetical protein
MKNALPGLGLPFSLRQHIFMFYQVIYAYNTFGNAIKE